MNKTTLDAIRKLTNSDKKNLSQKHTKLSEESGELAKAILPYEDAHGTNHRFNGREKILEEVADCFLCLRSIAYHVGATDDEIEEWVLSKTRKWAEVQKRDDDAEFPVPFEFHVTVQTDNIPEFRKTCAALGVKPIVLDLQDRSGTHIMHDVMTSSTHIGTNSSAYAELCRIDKGLKDDGFNVVRQKIEAASWHPMAPSAEYEDQSMPKDCYFEAHIGILCTPDDLTRLKVCLKMYDSDIHLSQNVFKRYDDGSFRIMATIRKKEGWTRESFDLHVKGIAENIHVGHFDVEKIITEFSIYDTQVSHDTSWINA